MNDGKKKVGLILDLLQEQGWRIVYNGVHYKVFPPDQRKPMVVIAASPSDWRAIKNICSSLKKSGARITTNVV